MDRKKLMTSTLLMLIFQGAFSQTFQWGYSLPSENGFSSEKLYAMRDTLARHSTTSLLVIRDDKVVLDWYAPGWDPDRPHYTASLAKALVGGMSLLLALNDHRLGIDDPVSRYVPEWKYDLQKSKITIRQLATHTSGLADAELTQQEIDQAKAAGQEVKTSHRDMPGWKGDFWRQNPDPFTLARDKAPVLFTPGAAYQYSNPGMGMLAYAITASYAGSAYRDIRSLLKEKLMDPLGIRDKEWDIGYGKTFHVNNLDLVADWGGADFTPQAVARIGRLMLNQGNWDGKQLVDSSWVSLVTRYAGMPMETGDAMHPTLANGLPWYVNYEGMWPSLPRDAFMGAGAGNQFLLVIPSLKMIVVRNGGDMYDPSKGEGFYYGILKYIADPLMASFNVPPYPASDFITGASFAPVTEIVRQASGSDGWPLTWADDDNLYSAYGDGRGFEPLVDKKLSLGLAKISGGPENFHGINIRTSTGEQTGDGRQGKKISSMVMVNWNLYMFLRNDDGDGRGSRLAWSKDHGKTWTYADWAFRESFGYPVFLNFGKNYDGSRDNYVYLYSPDEADAYKPSDRMVLARVMRGQLKNRENYEFYKGLDTEGKPIWTADISQRAAVFVHPAMCARSGITWDAGLKRYLWCQVIPQSSDPVGNRFQGGFGIYEAPEPWGPWRTVFYTREWDTGPGESSSLPTKWMSKDGKTCHLVFSGNDSFSVRKVTFDIRSK